MSRTDVSLEETKIILPFKEASQSAQGPNISTLTTGPQPLCGLVLKAISAATSREQSPGALSTENLESVYFQAIIEKLAEIQRGLVGVEVKVEDLAQKCDKTVPSSKLTRPTDNVQQVLPLNNREAVLNFELQLDDNSIMNEFLIFIDKISGDTPEENVKKIFTKIFTNEFARNHTWGGRKDRFSVSELKVMKITKEKILNDWDNFRESDFNREGKEWFRLGNQRYHREEKKKHQS